MNLIEHFLAAPTAATAVVDGEQRWSSVELDRRSARLAGGLRARGIDRGDPVLFRLGIEADAIALYRACWRLGAVAVAIHHQAGTSEVSDIVGRFDDPLVIAGSGQAHDDASIVDPGVLADAAPFDPVVDCEDDERALVMFTSGSSGTPKGVTHTHGSLAYKAQQLRRVHDLSPADVALMPAPLAHVSGLLHAVTCPGVAGSTAVLMDRWDAARGLQLIEDEAVTYMVGPPAFFLGMMDLTDFRPERAESLRFLSVGGTSISAAFVERARSELGCVVKRAYGSTEAPTATTSRNDDPLDRQVGTDGRSFDDTELALDPASGEVSVRGPEVSPGYLDPADDLGVFEHGWYRTGDVGRLDDGWLTITGRLGSGIIRGGENITPSAVEAHLEAHSAVRSAVVVGAPDELLGERVAAFVVLDAPFDLERARLWCAERGATRFSWPERLEVVDEFPLLPSGKPDRRALTDRL